MFRSDRDALAQEVDDLRHEQERLRSENEAMRTDLLARGRVAQRPPGADGFYKGGAELLSQGERAALAHHSLERTSTAQVVVLHYLTFGLWSLVHFSMMHDRLPQAERDDPSGARALGFSFIPYFNVYWIPFNTLRIVDRLNLQLRLRGEPEISKNLALMTAIFTFVPYLNILIAFWILWPILIAKMQGAVNRLAELDSSSVQQAAHTGVRIPKVEDLPLPDDVAAQQEADAALDEEAAKRRQFVPR